MELADDNDESTWEPKDNTYIGFFSFWLLVAQHLFYFILRPFQYSISRFNDTKSAKTCKGILERILEDVFIGPLIWILALFHIIDCLV